MADVVSQTNQKFLSSFSGTNIMNVVGWLLLVVIIVGAGAWYYIYYRDKKQYNKKITTFEIVGINFIPTYRDVAKSVKIGKGGFEILYLKKLKTWKIAYGGRVGKNDYYFFIMPDGYWYNGMLSANIFKIDELKGLVPILTTNPNMRSQYTSLEKQIDSLHENKVNWLEKYGSWLFAIAFILIGGVLLWLSFKEYSSSMSHLSGLVDKIGLLIDKINTLQSNQIPQANGGLIPVK